MSYSQKIHSTIYTTTKNIASVLSICIFSHTHNVYSSNLSSSNIYDCKEHYHYDTRSQTNKFYTQCHEIISNNNITNCKQSKLHTAYSAGNLLNNSFNTYLKDKDNNTVRLIAFNTFENGQWTSNTRQMCQVTVMASSQYQDKAGSLPKCFQNEGFISCVMKPKSDQATKTEKGTFCNDSTILKIYQSIKKSRIDGLSYQPSSPAIDHFTPSNRVGYNNNTGYCFAEGFPTIWIEASPIATNDTSYKDVKCLTFLRSGKERKHCIIEKTSSDPTCSMSTIILNKHMTYKDNPSIPYVYDKPIRQSANFQPSVEENLDPNRLIKDSELVDLNGKIYCELMKEKSN